MAVPRYMLDTTVFNRLLDGSISADRVHGRGLLYATHVQLDELTATRNERRCQQLLDMFREVAPIRLPTSSLVFDISRWDESEWGADDGVYENMLAALDERELKDNNPRDILIAETAYRHTFGLVTDDGNLLKVVRSFGVIALRLPEFLALPLLTVDAVGGPQCGDRR